MAKIGAIHYNWSGCDLEGFAQRASEIGYRYCELQIGDIWDGESKNGKQTAETTRGIVGQIRDASLGGSGRQRLPASRQPRLGRANRALPLRLPNRHGHRALRRRLEPQRRGARRPWDGMLLEAFKRCADFLEEYDVRIALDNHGISTNDGDWQLSLIERVGSDRLGVNLDTMNYR